MNRRIAGVVAAGALTFGACGSSGSSPEASPPEWSLSVPEVEQVPPTVPEVSQPSAADSPVDFSSFPPECGEEFQGNFSLAGFSGEISPEDLEDETNELGGQLVGLINLLGALGVEEVQLADGDHPDIALSEDAISIDPNHDQRYDPVDFKIDKGNLIILPDQVACQADDGTLYRTAVASYINTLSEVMLQPQAETTPTTATS